MIEELRKRYEPFGFYVVPRTGKHRLCLSDQCEITATKIVIGEEADMSWFAPDPCGQTQEEYNAYVDEVLKEHHHKVTGYGLHPGNGLAIIDVDDTDWFANWRVKHDFTMPILMTNKGFHLFIRLREPFRKIVHLSYGSFFAAGATMTAGQDFWYPTRTNRKFMRVEYQKTNRKYCWLVPPEVGIPIIDPFKSELLPEWTKRRLREGGRLVWKIEELLV